MDTNKQPNAPTPPVRPGVIQVVPQLKPARCGVTDHALLLARELDRAFGICTAFVVLNSTEPCDIEFERLYCAPTQLHSSCSSLINGRPGAVLVHVSGYGYSADGAPAALADALESLGASGQFRIGAYFHELFATGMFWESAFWHTRRQKRAVLRIANIADLPATNLSFHARFLDRHMDPVPRRPVPRNPVLRLPVFSNFGESAAIPPIAERRPAMAVLGLPSTRQKSYRQLAAQSEMLKTLGVNEILDIGPECESPSSVAGIPITRKGVLNAAAAATLLRESRFGFVPHPAFCLAKSGVFAGLAAHGVIPVLARPFTGEMDGLLDGLHLVSPRTAKSIHADRLDRCSASVWQWYLGHRLHTHAEAYARWLTAASQPESAMAAPLAVP